MYFNCHLQKELLRNLALTSFQLSSNHPLVRNDPPPTLQMFQGHFRVQASNTLFSLQVYLCVTLQQLSAPTPVFFSLTRYNIRLSSIIYPFAACEDILHFDVLHFYSDGSVYKNSLWKMSSPNISLPTPAVHCLAWGKFVKLFMIS